MSTVFSVSFSAAMVCAVATPSSFEAMDQASFPSSWYVKARLAVGSRVVLVRVSTP